MLQLNSFKLINCLSDQQTADIDTFVENVEKQKYIKYWKHNVSY